MQELNHHLLIVDGPSFQGDGNKERRVLCRRKGMRIFLPEPANAELYQDVDVSCYTGSIDRGLVSFTYSSYVRSWSQRPADQAIEVVEYRNAGGDILDSFKSEPARPR